MNQVTFDSWVAMFVRMFFTDHDRLVDILEGRYSLPSLDGKGKMSKSNPNQKSAIWLTDDRETIKKKIARIPSTPEHDYIFVSLFWNFFPEEEKQAVVKEAKKRIIKQIWGAL